VGYEQELLGTVPAIGSRDRDRRTRFSTLLESWIRQYLNA
jgi:DNA-directed RNA polymerase sigma subunit (sigma70/sigma32)